MYQFLKTVYIDASDGFRDRDYKFAGIAIVCSNTFLALPVPKSDTNTLELEALKLARTQILIRPIQIITDSLFAVHHYKERGVVVKWQKRCSCPELQLADVLSKIVARRGKSMKGSWCLDDVAKFAKVLDYQEEKKYKRMVERSNSHV